VFSTWPPARSTDRESLVPYSSPPLSEWCGPARLAGAPVTDYSVLDTWRPLLHADCSALRIGHPKLVTDLTRRPTLDALRPLRIAPLATPCARAGHGSLRARITPCSALGTLHRIRIAPHSTLSAPRRSRRPPLATPCTLYQPRIAPCPVVGPP
jgi:hypothetical protein